MTVPEALLARTRFFERCADQFLGGVGTQPEWAVSGVDFPTLLETSSRIDRLNAQEISAEWQRALSDSSNGKRVTSDLYFHVPFCPTVCGYCPFYTKGGDRQEQVEFYVKRLIAETEFFAPVLSRLRVENVYVGGGSPSVLSGGQIERLFRRVQRTVRFDPGFQQTFECDPLTITREKLALLRGLGFNRISMGVQSLNPSTLQAMARGYQEFGRLRSVAQWVHELGFPMFNLDLIVGLHGDDADSFLESFQGVASLRPSDITVNLLRPIKKYVQRYYQEDAVRCKSEIAGVIAEVARTIEAAAAAEGYSWVESTKGTLAWFFYRQGVERTGDYDDRVGRNIFGIGSAARSTIHGRMAYENRAPLDAAFLSRARVYGRVVQDEDMAMQVYVLRCLQEPGWIDAVAFSKRFGRDFEQVFASALQALATLQRIERREARWSLKVQGDRERFVYGLFFLGQQRLRKFLDGWDRIVTKIETEIEGLSVEFRLERPRPGQRYAASVAGVGVGFQVRVSRPHPPSRPSRRVWLVLELLKKSLTQGAARRRELSIPEIAAELHARLGAILTSGAPLLQGIVLKPLLIQAVDEDGAGIG